MIEVLGFIAYGLVFTLPTYAITLLILSNTNIDTKYMYPIWLALILLMIWAVDGYLILL
jgi:hypothetical protein